MSQPVKLSDGLVLDARQVGRISERSIAGQIEFWARLGRALEPILSGDRVLALKRAGEVKPLSRILKSVDSAKGRKRVVDHLKSRPFPHYEPHPDRRGMLIRTGANGRRSVGRFVNREFRVAD